MRYRVIFSSLILLLCIGLSQGGSPARVLAQDVPTKAPIAPTHVPPTKQPPSSGGTKAPLPPTDVPPTKAPIPLTEVPPTKTLWPTVGATAQMSTETPWPTPTPTNTLAPTEAAQSAAGLSTSQPPSADTTSSRSAAPRTNPQTSTEPTIVSQLAAPPLIGVVFDDRNGNGVHDPDELGLSGVVVIVESPDRSQTLVTNASGLYTTTLDPAATAHVVPPAGWVAARPESLPLDVSRNFALRQSVAPSPLSLRPVATLTQTVLDLAPLVTIGGLLAAVLGFGLIQIGRTVSTGNRQLALTLVRLQRTTEQPITFEEDKTGTLDRARDPKVLALLNQAALDAVDRSLRIEQVLKVGVDPAAAIIAYGSDRQRAAFVVFTPLMAKAFRAALQPDDARHLVAELPVEAVFEGAAHYPLDRLGEALVGARAQVVDAVSSGLFIADDLAAAFQYLAGDLPVAMRTLPRAGRWHLLIGPIPRNTLKVQTGRCGRLRHAFIQLTRNLRKGISA